MKERVEHKETFKVEPSELYHAWLDSEKHGEMTGGEADCTDIVGGNFTTWDGYICGKNVELVENEKIVQTWRTSEFQEDDEDSHLTISFHKITDGTEMVLSHSNIPEGQTQYEKGWVDNYFVPMKRFFEG